MKTVLVLTYLIILVCVTEIDCGLVRDFFLQVKHDVESAFNTAWTKIAAVIKQPVRPKGRRKKRTTPLTSTMAPPEDMSTIAIYLFSSRRWPTVARPTIPVFTTPPYISVVEWRRQQMPLQWRPIEGLQGSLTAKPKEVVKPKENAEEIESIPISFKNKINRNSDVLFFT